MNTAVAVLISHQRMDNGGPCLCGWNELGKMHATHLADKLREAGVLKDDAGIPAYSHDDVSELSDVLAEARIEHNLVLGTGRFSRFVLDAGYRRVYHASLATAIHSEANR